MKKVIVAIMCAVAAAMVSGCGIVNNATSNVNSIQTEVSLAQKNFAVVGTVSTDVKQSYVFGIGGLSKKALEQNAVAKLTEKANLSGSQALVNVVCQTNVKFFTPIYVKRTVIAKGTIVEFR